MKESRPSKGSCLPSHSTRDEVSKTLRIYDPTDLGCLRCAACCLQIDGPQEPEAACPLPLSIIIQSVSFSSTKTINTHHFHPYHNGHPFPAVETSQVKPSQGFQLARLRFEKSVTCSLGDLIKLSQVTTYNPNPLSKRVRISKIPKIREHWADS